MAAEVLGRDVELAALREFLDRVPEGPSALVLEGEPGIGKTTLWSETLAQARTRSYRVLSARPSQAEAVLPFAGLIELLEGVLDEALTELAPPQGRALEAAVLRAEPTGSATDQIAVSLALLSILRALARESPTIVAVDDLQWLDAPSARVLAFALRRFVEEPLALVVSRRTTEDNGALPLDLGRVPWLERAELVRVGPLSMGALDLLLRSRLDLALSRSRLAALLEHSGGNPFYALELGRAVIAGGTLEPGGALRVPATLAELVQGRIRRASEEARELLLLVAALSRPSASVLTSHHEQLHEALETGLLVRDGDRLTFSHPLYSSAVYADAQPERRREAHRLLANLLEDPEERAMHLALSAETPDEPVAAALEEAAGRAAMRGATDRAAELAEQARRLTPVEQTDAELRRSFAAADYHAAAGDGPRARTILERLVATLPAGPVKASAYLRLAALATEYATIARLCRKALAHAGEDPALGARAHLVLGWAEGLSGGGFAVWEEGACRAAELAEEAGDIPVRVLALANLAVARGFRGFGVQRELVERVLELDPEGEIVVLGESPRVVLGLHLENVDELDEGRVLLEDVLELATERGWIPVQANALFNLSFLECRQGDFGEAHRLAAESLELGRQLDLWNLEPLGLFAVAYADAHRGRVESARASAEASNARARTIGDMNVLTGNEYVLGLLALSLGDATTAHRHLELAVELTRSLGMADPGAWPVLPNEIEALAALGKQSQAEALLRELEEEADRLDRARPLALAARSRAIVEADRGNLAAAHASIERALGAHERLPDPFERARTQLVQGAILRKARKKGEAKAVLGEALASFEDLGTPLWAERARDEISRLGLRRSAPGDLTEAEAKVAELVAAGRTNREVAAELFLSVKTVEANLSRIYRKVGVRSRTELAGALGDRVLHHDAGASDAP
jgi:DNA-binding CsgD family transcriptional regulator